jgi:hypothetical protein
MNGMVAALFERLEQSGLRYVILRNYEQLCDAPAPQHGQATDIDLVIATEDVPRWRSIAISLADDLGWDALTECDHFTQSRKHEHHIEIFRYYRYPDQCFLQVDVFHSYLIWGLPFANEQELLEGRVSDRERRLTRIDPVKENTFRLLQIQGLIGHQHSLAKIARYRDRILRFDQEHREEFRRFLYRNFGTHSERILDALASQDWARYRKHMRIGKALFWMRFASRKPMHAAQFLAARLVESRKRYLARPCGGLVKVYVEDTRARDRVVAILSNLKRLNFIDQWHEISSGARLDKEALIIREQGGLLIQWTQLGQADLRVTSEVSCTSIWQFIVNLLVRQHAALFRRADVIAPVHACVPTPVEV